MPDRWYVLGDDLVSEDLSDVERVLGLAEEAEERSRLDVVLVILPDRPRRQLGKVVGVVLPRDSNDLIKSRAKVSGWQAAKRTPPALMLFLPVAPTLPAYAGW